MPTSIEWDCHKVKKLRRRYEEAVDKKETEFKLFGRTFLTRYAMYLLQLLEGQLGA